jgi:hypothetical protein
VSVSVCVRVCVYVAALSRLSSHPRVQKQLPEVLKDCVQSKALTNEWCDLPFEHARLPVSNLLSFVAGMRLRAPIQI